MAPRLVDGQLQKAKVLQCVPGLKASYPAGWSNLLDQLDAFETFRSPGGAMEPARIGLALASIEGSVHSTFSMYLGFLRSKLGVAQPTLEQFANGRSWYLWYIFQFSCLTSAGSSRKHCNATCHILSWLQECAAGDEQLVDQLYSMELFVQQLASTVAKMERIEELHMVRQPVKRQQAMAVALRDQRARLFPTPAPASSLGSVAPFNLNEVGGNWFTHPHYIHTHLPPSLPPLFLTSLPPSLPASLPPYNAQWSRGESHCGI